MTNKTPKFTIQQAAALLSLSEHTLRYYERVGLIHPIPRADNTHRRYTQEDIGWIEFLMKLRATGMSIQKMQVYAQLQREGDATLQQRVQMLKELRNEVEARLQVLKDHLGLIRYKIDFYSDIIEQAERAPETA
jgi:DNA-binding transcriptional MerR regulator